MIRKLIFGAALFASTFTTAHAKAPAAPSKLSVTPLGANSFLLKWKDNSKDELGWELRVSQGVTKNPVRFQLVPTPNLTSHIVITTPVPGSTLSFQIAAYNGKPGAEVYSKRSAVVTAKALATKTFSAPAKLTVKSVSDSAVRLSWSDKSTTEHGYQIEARKGLDAWTPLAIAPPNLKYSVDVTGLEPGTGYSFRVRGYMTNPVVFTGYSNVSNGNTLPFLAPSDLKGTARGEGEVYLKWTDSSTVEGGYEVESKSGSAAFSKLWTSAPNARTLNITNNSLNTTFSYRVRAYRVVNGVNQYSNYSKTISVKTGLLYAPTGLTGTVLGDTSVRLNWTDKSSRESAFAIQYRKAGTTDYTSTFFPASANSTQYTLSGLDPDTNYEFRVGATDYTNPNFTPAVALKTKHGIVGNLTPPFFTSKKFLYQIQFTSTANITHLTVTGLPAGLTFDSVTRTIKGTYTGSSTTNVTLTATYADGTVSTRTLVLKPINGNPVAVQSFANVSVNAGASKNVAVTGKFSDPDTQSAARVVTTKGTFDIILFPDATPNTVSNFLDYVDDNRYDDSFFHRNPPGFVVQGGGFRHTTAGGYTQVPVFGQIPNEPGLSNLRGTVAMAKLGGQPDSATSQFFVNLDDTNAAGVGKALDTTNGGYTVFGRVPAAGMAVMDAINGLPRGDYTVTLGSTPALLEDVPVDAASAPVNLDPAQLVKITSVGAAPILTYQVVSQSTAVATAAMNPAGTEVIITGVAKGSTSVEVKATDLDGNTAVQNISVSVP